MIDKKQKQKLENIAALISSANDMLCSLLGELDAELDFRKFHLLHFVPPRSDDGGKK